MSEIIGVLIAYQGVRFDRDARNPALSAGAQRWAASLSPFCIGVAIALAHQW